MDGGDVVRVNMHKNPRIIKSGVARYIVYVLYLRGVYQYEISPIFSRVFES